ncbi:hypothetical protein, partial [Streptomyces sedi]
RDIARQAAQYGCVAASGDAFSRASAGKAFRKRNANRSEAFSRKREKAESRKRDSKRSWLRDGGAGW